MQLMGMFTRLMGLKIFVSSVLMFIFLNVLFNYLNHVENILRIRKVKKINNIEDETRNYFNRFISSDVSTSELSTSSFNKVLNGQLNTIVNNSIQHGLELECMDPPSDQGGPITPNATLEPLDAVEERLKPFLKTGGWFQPRKCKAKHRVAIVVPFRDRYAHLAIFLRNIHLFLMKQNLEYRIFIVEQTNGKPFNRAALMNIGYLEALKFYIWDCFVFHDVDLLPLDERNLYTCPRQPRHMSVAIDTLGFRLPYKTIFGGVSAMTREQFSAVNGFSNSFFGWGGEDDDMSNRLTHANLYISRYPINIARYMMLSHKKGRANPKRYEKLVTGAQNFEKDGINSIQYKIYSTKEFPLFTWFLAELKMLEQKCQI